MNVFLLMCDLILTTSIIPIVYLEGNVCLCLNCLHLSDRGQIVLTGVSRSGVVVPESAGPRLDTVACMDSALSLTLFPLASEIKIMDHNILTTDDSCSF